jgi:hypothetical protein
MISDIISHHHTPSANSEIFFEIRIRHYNLWINFPFDKSIW